MAQEGSNTFFSPILMVYDSPVKTTNTQAYYLNYKNVKTDLVLAF